MDDPTIVNPSCSCWSTCSVAESARMCDGASPKFSNYSKAKMGDYDVGCHTVPFANNARSLCVWEYDYNDGLVKAQRLK